jgi:DNA polymerase-3 subunit beta
MKFAVSSDRMRESLSKVSAVVPAKTTLPILQDILFELNENTLKLTATDLEISVTLTMSVDGERDGIVAIPESKLTSIIKALPEGLLLTFESIDSERVVIRTDKGGEYKMSAESSESFPATPEFSDSDSFSIDGNLLKETIDDTIFAVSKDELRPSLMGVLFQFKEDEFRAVATDGHRLVKIAHKGIDTRVFSGKEVIVPAKTLQIIARSLNDEECNIAINEKHVRFNFGDTVVISRLIDEKYPNYESVIPYDNNKELVIEKDMLLSSVKRVSIFASSSTNQIKLSLNSETEMEVSAEDIDFGGEAREVINCEYRGETMEIAFNAKYIIDILNHIESEKVIFRFSTPTRAAVVEPAESPDNKEVLMLVMPMRLNS